jgi:hypothetical protein
MHSQGTIHLIAFDIPYPADYGGVQAVFYHLQALKAKGVKVILHCFEYNGRTQQAILEDYCIHVYYYPRRISIFDQLHFRPFIVQSRRDKRLLLHLLQDDYPIIFEGLHTTAWIAHPALAARQKTVRMHNVEWQYYKAAAAATSLNFKASFFSFLKKSIEKTYFFVESIKLYYYEKKILPHLQLLLTLSKGDERYYKNQVDTEKCGVERALFHPYTTVNSLLGQGEYLLFHGKLSVEDNAQSALFLVETVFSKQSMPCIIAGSNPSEALRRLVANYPNIHIESNPSDEKMQDLIKNAHAHVLWSFQSAGIKFKLLHSLFNGRFVLANDFMAADTGLEKLCLIANTSSDLLQIIEQIRTKAVDETLLLQRKKVLNYEL